LAGGKEGEGRNCCFGKPGVGKKPTTQSGTLRLRGRGYKTTREKKRTGGFMSIGRAGMAVLPGRGGTLRGAVLWTRGKGDCKRRALQISR